MAKDSSGKKAVQAGLGYTIGNVFVKGLSFLAIPIFARLLSVADYGVYSTFSSYVSIMTIVVGLALHSAIKNAKLDYKGRLNPFCSSVALLVLFNTGLCLVLSIVFASPLAALLSLERPSLVVLIILESFGMTMISYYNNVLAVDFRYKTYLVLSLIYAVSGIVLSVLFIVTVFSQERYLGRILGTLLPAVVIGLYVLVGLFRTARPRCNREFWRYALKISLPIVPHGLSQLLLAQFDRIMIKTTIGSEQAGLYGFAYHVGTIFQVISNSLDTAWLPWFFERMEEKNYSAIRKAGRAYTALVSLGAIALLLICPELITIMGGAKYAPSRYVAIPIVLAMFYAFLYTLPSAVEYYYKKTMLIAIGTLSAAVLNIVLNAYFIPRYGYIAAAYTTIVCYVAYYGAHVFLSRRVHGGFVYDMGNQMLWAGGVTAFAFGCLPLVDWMWIRMGILAAGLVVGVVCAIHWRARLLEFLGAFRKKA